MFVRLTEGVASLCKVLLMSLTNMKVSIEQCFLIFLETGPIGNLPKTDAYNELLRLAIVLWRSSAKESRVEAQTPVMMYISLWL